MITFNNNIIIKLNSTKKYINIYLYNKLFLILKIKLLNNNNLMSNKVYTYLYLFKILRSYGLVKYNFINKLKFFN